MTKAEDYAERAEEVRTIADNCVCLDTKNTYLNIAAMYERLAIDAERWDKCCIVYGIPICP